MSDPSLARPLISVVIPAYNHGRYLPDAIESVLGQSYRNVEVIVVDDGSTDDTLQVVCKYLGIKYVRQKNAGLASARNRGIQESTGRYLLFLDADDRLTPSALESALNTISQHHDCGFVYGQFGFVDENWQTLSMYDPPPNNPDTYLGLFGGNHIAMCATVLFQRAALEHVGGFRPELHASEDYDLYFRIAGLFPYYRHGAKMAECRRHGENMSKDAALMLRATLDVVKNQRARISTDAKGSQAYVRCLRVWKDYYGGIMIREARQYVRSGRILCALREVGLVLKLAPTTLIRSAAQRLRSRTQLLFCAGVGRLSSVFSPSFSRVEPVSRNFGFDRGTPVDRYYIDRAVGSRESDIHGRVLEIKDDTYTRKFGGSRVTQADVLDIDPDNSLSTITADLTDARQIPDDTFDSIVITQTLHIIYDVKAAVKTLHRILKPKGVVVATLPAISQTCRHGTDLWQDQWRFSEASAERLFKDIFGERSVAVSAYGNLYAAVNFLDGRAVEELARPKLDVMDPDYPLVICVRAVKSGHEEVDMPALSGQTDASLRGDA